MRWPVQPRDYSKWANKQGKVSLDISCSTKRYAAKVVKLNGKFTISLQPIIKSGILQLTTSMKLWPTCRHARVSPLKLAKQYFADRLDLFHL